MKSSSDVALQPSTRAPAVFSRAKSSLLRLVVEVAFLCWPALVLNGGPLVFPDTASYFAGGKAISDRLAAMLQHHESLSNAEMQGARAVRSVLYSAFAYYPSVLCSIWLVILLQATFVACSLRALFRLSLPYYDGWGITLLIVVLAVFTTVSWCASLMMPDVFAGVMITCLITVVLFWECLQWPSQLVTLGIIGISMLMHLSNLPLVLGVLFCAALLRIRSWRLVWPAYASVAGVIAGAVCFILAGSVIGFKQWSLAPNAPPYLLARSIEDGPGRLYLLEHCPQIGLAMCRHLDRLQITADDFLWHKNGVYSVVPRAEASQLRAEGNRVFEAAALEHPWMQIKASLRNVAYQIGFFTLGEFRVPSYFVLENGEMATFPWAAAVVDEVPPDPGRWKVPLYVAEYSVVILSVIACGVLWGLGKLSRTQRDIFLLAAVTVLINAGVMVTSTPAPRYGARVIWLLPMAALIAVCGRALSARPATQRDQQ